MGSARRLSVEAVESSGQMLRGGEVPQGGAADAKKDFPGRLRIFHPSLRVSAVNAA
jgi:hypothetical protein